MKSCNRGIVLALLLLTGCVAEPSEGASAQAVAGPTGLTLSSTLAQQIDASWSALPPSTKYYVYQAPEGQTLAYVASVLGATAYSATGLVAGARYCFAVVAAFPDGSESDASASVCGAAGGAAGMIDNNIPLLPFTGFNWTITLNSTPSLQIYLESSGAGAAYVWIPSQPGRSLISVTLSAEAPSGGSFISIRVMRFFRDDTAADSPGVLVPVPGPTATWSDIVIPTTPTPSNSNYDIAIKLDAQTSGLRVKGIHATWQ